MSEPVSDPVAASGAVVRGDRYRFTVLTSRLVRMEWSEDGMFVDLPTQLALHRRFDAPDFEVHETADALDLWTEHLHLSYDKGPFTPEGLSVTLRTKAQASHRTTWHLGDPDEPASDGNLGGTARTLDDVDGACPLEPGLLAMFGFSVLDDSRSLRLTPDGWFEPPSAGRDLYFFGHGRDFQGALRDFYRLAGPVPLVPRYVLGNWWSRYWRYTAEEYLALMDRFADERLPFSVAVLDMDWHLVDIDPSLGTGWTGYTWDRELYPDPPAFLAELHRRGLAVSLNVHPADGVRRHEEAYADVARDLGLDPEDGREIPFDITSRDFVAAYLERLHHPLEAEGVDFWWLDWQSGGVSRVPGVDPLWLLNHLHFIDSGRDGRRPLTFSRYAGLGSHRYPVGFSGDTITSWASLDFQPRFTATAANIGYLWWSHDIGGHMLGAKDDELATRWLQLGVLSPVNRLHSSASPFSAKEPWRYGVHAREVMGHFLRLRHLLVPYLYTAAWTAHADGVGVARPMYHDHPTQDAAFSVPNQYLLGPDLLVAPITTPTDPATGLAGVAAWLPEGRWFDLLTGSSYDAPGGGRSLVLHRPLDQVPVLVRAGAVVPLLTDPLADVGPNPTSLVLRVFPGPSGDSGGALIEDDGAGSPTLAQRQETRWTLSWPPSGGDVLLTLQAPTGPGALTTRDLTLDLVDVASVSAVEVVSGNRASEVAVEVASEVARVGDAEDPLLAPALRVPLGPLDLSGGCVIRLRGVRRRDPDLAATAFALLAAAQTEMVAKEQAYAAVQRLSGVALVEHLHTLDLPPSLSGALVELISASARADPRSDP